MFIFPVVFMMELPLCSCVSLAMPEVIDEVRAVIPQLPAEETVAPPRPWPRVT